MSANKKVNFDEREKDSPSVVRRFMSASAAEAEKDNRPKAGQIDKNKFGNILSEHADEGEFEPAALRGHDVTIENPQTSAQKIIDRKIADKIIPMDEEPEEKAMPVSKKSAGDSAYYFVNTMEEAVVNEVEATMKNTKGMCKCRRCFSDVCAIVLNSVKPHYVTSNIGELYDKAALLNIVNLSKISVEVFRAIDIVKDKPSHD